jgi:hypothetical protein
MVRKYKNWLFLSFLVGIVCICPAGILAQEKIPSVINLEKISDYYFDADPALGIGEVSSPEFSSHFSPVGEGPSGQASMHPLRGSSLRSHWTGSDLAMGRRAMRRTGPFNGFCL